MGNSGPAYQVSTFSNCTDDLHIGGILQVIRTGDSPITWSASIYSIRPGPQVNDSLLEGFPEGHGDIVDDEHRFSSTDGRSVREDYPGFRGHAAGMRPGF